MCPNFSAATVIFVRDGATFVYLERLIMRRSLSVSRVSGPERRETLVYCGTARLG
jgi:hypothetical protein